MNRVFFVEKRNFSHKSNQNGAFRRHLIYKWFILIKKANFAIISVGYETKNNIDLSKCKTLCVERNFQSVSGGYFHVNLYDINGNQALHMNSHDNGTTIEKIDVASLNGSYRIYVHVYTYLSSAVPVVDVTRIWRE